MTTPFKQPNDSKRQKLIPDNAFPELQAKAVMAVNSIESEVVAADDDTIFDAKLAELKRMLQTALELEHSTIPPYLCALYSIKPGTNLTATEIIKSVVLEEMLHMIMVANLINAVNGKPCIGAKETDNDGNFIPDYPTPLPGNVDPKLNVSLACFSKESIRTFWKIEHPEGGFAIPEELLQKGEKSYPSIGAFYEALVKDITALETMASQKGKTIFTGDPARQVPSEHYYGAGGKIITVFNLEDAKNVIGEIVGQGEGTLGSIFSEPFNPGDERYLMFGPTVEEYAHYFRFKEVHYERYYAPTDSAHRDSPNHGLPTGKKFEVDWEAVCKMKPNPKMSDYPKGSPLYEKTYDFNKTYSALLDNINEACNGRPAALRDGIMLMYDLKYKAIELMNIPREDGLMAGPSFEYVKS
ncbi:ferritin-like domain-containing protein [Arachidicoccus terrestris]|uniref:ferritin-like domain-containing protein n=1 Tax=Arachidicoccus terrestris TaxID=2875539 RepID=UPI001CC74913|nr:ferritin-like protein [Arachidicoccus terrestris]UAY56182.1 ferritin-like protein [Arachidicoccus terrestris]